MFRGPSFIVSTMQEETTPIFKRLWYDWTQQQPGIEPTNPLGQCWVPPIVAFYDQQGLLRTSCYQGAPSRAPTPDPYRGDIQVVSMINKETSANHRAMCLLRYIVLLCGKAYFDPHKNLNCPPWIFVFYLHAKHAFYWFAERTCGQLERIYYLTQTTCFYLNDKLRYSTKRNRNISVIYFKLAVFKNKYPDDPFQENAPLGQNQPTLSLK